jgi:hypothetical protein
MITLHMYTFRLLLLVERIAIWTLTLILRFIGPAQED